ncbi:MAG: DUF3622 domain-containing protein [Thiohalomonadales bacterium]
MEEIKVTKGKKYTYRVVQKNNVWVTEIIRRVTSKKFHVSKSKDGFTSESDAQNWGKQEIKSFIQSLNERNKRNYK